MSSEAAMASEAAKDEQALEREVIARGQAAHHKARWPAGFEQAGQRPYQLCKTTVMDSSDPEIRFDGEGVSHWAHDFEREVTARLPSADQRERALRAAVEQMRSAGKGGAYDCVVGLSGGVDSSYLCVLAVELGLRPLVVHFDNGWNSELAVQNIERLVRKLKLDLHTFVMDWPEFRDLQRAYFKASVLDLEVPTDHMIVGAVSRLASQHDVRWILSGANLQTEWLLPRTWYYSKFDLANLKGIHRTYGAVPLKKLPSYGLAQSIWFDRVKRVRSLQLLDLMVYDKPAAKRRLMDEFGWRDYGGKHHESVFTRFYQSHILPTKFNVDKRKAHLSNLILSGQLSRSQALRELLDPPCDERVMREDFSFVAKKLGFSQDEFTQVLTQPNRAHEEFGSDRQLRANYQKTLRELARGKSWLRARLRRGLATG